MNLKRSGVIAGTVLASALVLSACSSDADNAIAGEGASSQQVAMSHFADVYNAESGNIMAYTASGSGAGIQRFIAGEVDFGGSDSALKDAEVEGAAKRCGGNDAWHVPLVVGPVAIAYNLEGVDDLALSVDVIAKIFSGQITAWDDAAIVALNPGVKLPSSQISTVHRSDKSGTSENFMRFLSASAPGSWTKDGKPIEATKEFAGYAPGAQPVQGSQGVAESVSKAPNSITYVEAGFAHKEKLGVARIDFGKGAVELNDESAGKALDAVKFKEEGSKNLVVDSKSLFGMKEAGAYPLLLTTYEIVCSKGYGDDAKRDRVKEFLNVALGKGQENLPVGYVKLPEGYKAKMKATVDAIS